MNVERVVHRSENGYDEYLYCRLCGKELAAEFYNRSSVQQLLRVHDCPHYQWVFVGDPFLDPPQDKETREILDTAIAKVDTNGGKYFLLPILSRE